jgi:hypothetical protein
MKAFDDWLWQREGFGYRADRLFADLRGDPAQYEIVINWLKAAYEIGKQEGNEVLKLLKDLEQ